MERSFISELKKWKDSADRKPLILQGVRQVGKTWLLREFGARYFERVAYLNFDESPELRDVFTATKDPRRITQNLSMLSGVAITPGVTLVIFDEIQECPEAISSLKYFCEDAPDLHIACAGSLLGVALARGGAFPVGKVNFATLRPMTFIEFLRANGDDGLAEKIESVDEIAPIGAAFLGPMLEKLKMYLVTGGMPEAVRAWTERHDTSAVERVLADIVDAYERDFAKYPGRNEFPKISAIWRSLPSQLARENKKFLYSAVKGGARAREYEDALEWLIGAGLVHKVYRSTAPQIPASAYDDLGAFKIYLADVGILRRMSRLAPSAFGEGERLLVEFKGALAENYALQSLIAQLDTAPRYWSQNNPPYEVDVLIQHENEIIPIDVKAGEARESRSLKKFKEIYDDRVRLRVRLSTSDLKLDGDLLNIPLPLADAADRLIGFVRLSASR